MARKPKGRRNRTPDKLTPETQKVIVEAIAAGVPQRHAAERAGVTAWTIQHWMRRGKKDRSGVYSHFFSAMKKAEADRLAASVARIGLAAKGGQVIERTTTTTSKTTKDGTTITNTKTVERIAPGQWTADAWFLERRHPDEFAGNRREVKELRDQLAALLKAVTSGKVRIADPDVEEVTPKVGGDADPKSV